MRIVILGGGTAGWMAAACMARTIGTRTHDITLIESSDIATIGVGEATIPMIDTFNAIVGLHPIDLVRQTEATFKLGIEFADWTRKGHSYFHPFGHFGKNMNGVSFTHYWLRQQAKGKDVSSGLYSLETQAAYAGKFTLQPPPQPDAPRLNHAYHFDAGLYAQALRRIAETHGVTRIDAKMSEVRLDADSGDVAALLLDDGREVEGDLFIDCSGFRALLIGKALGTDYVDWRHWLPCDRAVVTSSEVHDPLPAYTRATARDAGWQWRIPLQSRTGNGYVYASEFVDDDTAQEHLISGLDRPATGSVRQLRFTTGYRPRMWEKNVISMGLSSGFLEPLESTSIFLVQSALTKLMLTFPRGPIRPSIRDMFNNAMTSEFEYIRDFLVAHYTLTEREDTPFWQHCKTMDIPDSLQAFLEHYEEEAIFAERPHDLFKEASWFAVLSGQGLMPKRYHPVADAADDAAMDKQMAYLRERVSDRLGRLPSHDAFIKSCRDTGRRPVGVVA